MTETQAAHPVPVGRKPGSYTSLVLHRECPQAWQYKYLQGLQPIDDLSIWRDFGNWWHAYRAAFTIRSGEWTLQEVPDVIEVDKDNGPFLETSTITPESVLEEAHRWWQRLPGEEKALWEEQIGASLTGRLLIADDRWRTHWADDRKREEPLTVEMEWTREVTPGYLLRGKIDEVYRDSRRNLVVVRDYKSVKRMQASTTATDMMDSQLHLYAWGGAPKIKSWGKGSVMAVSYDRISSVAPRPPLLTLAGRIRLHNGQPSISMCDLQTYLEWCASHPEYEGTKTVSPGIYREDPVIVEKLSTPAAQNMWHDRTLVPVNLNLIRAHLQSAHDSMVDIDRTLERVEKTGEAPRNLSKRCDWCDFQGLCLAQMIGGADGEYPLEDFGLEKRDR